MPPIRKVKFDNTKIEITDKNGVKTLNATDIPASLKNKQAVEDWINNTWIPAHITEYQAQVHIFSINPIQVSVFTADLGETIPPSWWL